LVVAFVIFTGMNVTAIRCAIMITVYNLATLLRRRADSLSALGLAALILTIFSPYAARDTGMLLSILGVIGVGPVAGAINAAIRRRWKLKGIADTVCSAAVMSFGGSICTFPVLMLTFDEVSLIAPITNVLIIPASTIALVCAVMFAMIGGVSVIGTALCFIAGICMQFILWISNLMAGMTLAYVSLGSGYIVIWTLLTLTALIVAFIMLKSWSFSGYIGIAAVGVLLCSSLVVKALERDSLKISVMSDGIYGAVVCTSEEAAWVIKLGNGNDKLAKQIGDYLNLYDIDRIELLAMPTMRQSEAAVYSSRFDHFQIVSVVMPDEIMSSNPQLFEDSNKFIAQDMVISLDNGYNIDINWDGNNFDLLLYSDNFRLLCTQAANLSENTSLGQNDILVVTGKTKAELTLNSTPYSVVLNSKQMAHSNFGASIIYPFSEPRVEFKVYNDKVIKRRWGINVLY
ncbi:MAG TPA: ComEC/Rec2 family competence protein, partial [Oscillospiraceae bacterium]|nr:ComEC/Rec2 family competence protein [Oscillospiraceae bacterium]